MRMGKLEVSFYGTFVSLLDRNPVEIYAPRCVGHYGSIFTTEAEAPLEHDLHQGMRKIYRVTKSGIQANSSAATPVKAVAQLKPPAGFTLSSDEKRAWFCLQFPKPTHAVSIKIDPVRIKGTGAPTGTAYATALRLIFDYDMDRPDFELSEGTTPILRTTLQDYSSPSPQSSSRFDITVRLVGPFLFDPRHDDAYECFAASAKLFQSRNADLDWEVDYSGMVVRGRPGSDCDAPIFVSV